MRWAAASALRTPLLAELQLPEARGRAGGRTGAAGARGARELARHHSGRPHRRGGGAERELAGEVGEHGQSRQVGERGRGKGQITCAAECDGDGRLRLKALMSCFCLLCRVSRVLSPFRYYG